jgi:hypothetical protein
MQMESKLERIKETILLHRRLLSSSGFQLNRKFPNFNLVFEKLMVNQVPSEELLRESIKELENLSTVAGSTMAVATPEVTLVKQLLEACQQDIEAIQEPVSDTKTSLRATARTLFSKKEELEEKIRFSSQDQKSFEALIHALQELLEKQPLSIG